MPRHAALFLAVALSGAALDLGTKQAVFDYFAPAERQWLREVVVIDGLLSYGHVLNPGVVFGMGPTFQTFWKVVSVLAVPAIVAIFWFVKRPKWILTISLGMILAGTIGNMYDRLAYNAVRDFLKFFVVVDGREKVWPLFNLADSYICVGVFLLTVEMMFFDEKKKKASDPAPAPLPPAAPQP
jgi:signal peptidase II